MIRSWAWFDGIVGAVSIDDVVAPELAVNWPSFCFNRSHDRAAIGPLSRVDRDLKSQTTAVRSCATSWKDRGLDSALKEPRLWLDRTAIVDFFHESSQQSDGNLALLASP